MIGLHEATPLTGDQALRLLAILLRRADGPAMFTGYEFDDALMGPAPHIVTYREATAPYTTAISLVTTDTITGETA